MKNMIKIKLEYIKIQKKNIEIEIKISIIKGFQFNNILKQRHNSINF